jgi:hypothetical protein
MKAPFSSFRFPLTIATLTDCRRGPRLTTRLILMLGLNNETPGSIGPLASSVPAIFVQRDFLVCHSSLNIAAANIISAPN